MSDKDQVEECTTTASSYLGGEEVQEEKSATTSRSYSGSDKDQVEESASTSGSFLEGNEDQVEEFASNSGSDPGGEEDQGEKSATTSKSYSGSDKDRVEDSATTSGSLLEGNEEQVEEFASNSGSDREENQGGKSATASKSYTGSNKDQVEESASTSGNYFRFDKDRVVWNPVTSIGFGQLPNEILLEIFQYLDLKSIFACMYVCKRWETIANENSFWRKFYKRYVENLSNSSSSRCEQRDFSEKDWKIKFFNESEKMKNRLMHYNVGMNYFVGKVSERLGIKFQLSIESNDGKEVNIMEDGRLVHPEGMLLSFAAPLTADIHFEKIAALNVYSLTPILWEVPEEMWKEIPNQKSLILKEKICTNFINLNRLFDRNSEVDAYLTNSGVLICLWKDTDNLAFVYLCLHGHLLFKKCLYSSVHEIYSEPYESVLFEDESSSCKFACKLLAQTRNKRCFELIFLRLRPDLIVDRCFTFNFSERSFHNRLTQPEFICKSSVLENTSAFLASVQDSCANIIWSANSIVKFEKSQVFGKDGIKFIHQDKIGKLEMSFAEAGNTGGLVMYALRNMFLFLDLRGAVA